MPIRTDHKSTDEIQNQTQEGARGDFRGPYGFGRPAHRADPTAEYEFKPDPSRVLDASGQEAREARLRRIATRQGLFFSKARRRRGPDAEMAGGYMLFEDPTRAVAAFGAKADRGPWDVSGSGYQATLDEMEAYLLRGEDKDAVIEGPD